MFDSPRKSTILEQVHSSYFITEYMLQNSESQKSRLMNFIYLQNKKYADWDGRANPSEFTLGTLLQFVKEENLDKFLVRWKAYVQSLDDVEKVKWYIKKIFMQAKNFEAAKVCVPKQHWKHLQNVEFNGDGTVGILDNYCYDLLDQAQMNNVILGVRGT